MLAHGGSTIFRRPDWLLLRRLRKVAIAHNWLNIAIAVPPKLIPVLVTVIVSPSANAAFYVAWMLASFLFMVPTQPVDRALRDRLRRPGDARGEAALRAPAVGHDRDPSDGRTRSRSPTLR